METPPLHTAVWARELVEDLAKKGVPVSKLLAQAGVERRALNDESEKMPFDQSATLFELAAEMTGDDSLGFHFGQTRDIRDLGLIAYVGLSAPTLGDAIGNIVRYQRVFSEVISIDDATLHDDGRMVWRWSVPATIKRRQTLELAMTGFVRNFRRATGREMRPLAVSFIHPRNSNLAEYDRFFGCTVEFGAAETLIQFRLEDLFLPLRSEDHRLLKILRRHCEDVLGKHDEDTPILRAKVERLVTDRMARGDIAMDDIATELGMSQRTFARRLSEEGVTYKTVVDELRRNLAEAYLGESELSLTQIAYLLSYANVTSFNHSFRRWTGQSPGAARRSATG